MSQASLTHFNNIIGIKQQFIIVFIMDSFEIPKTCKAGVVVNEGPDFHVEIKTVAVPEPGRKYILRKTKCTQL